LANLCIVFSLLAVAGTITMLVFGVVVTKLINRRVGTRNIIHLYFFKYVYHIESNLKWESHVVIWFIFISGIYFPAKFRGFHGDDSGRGLLDRETA
jgi:hypothetical protein